MLLQKHGVVYANTRDQIDDFLRSKLGGATESLAPIDGDIWFACNAVSAGRFAMYSITCKFTGTFDFEPIDDIRLVCPIQSVARVAFQGRTIDVDPGHSNYILPVGTPVRKFHGSEYNVLSVRVNPSDLKSKLEALSGEPHHEPIVFFQPDAADDRYVRFVRRPLFAAARELDQAGPVFQTNLLEEIKAITLTRLLLFAPHNFSRLLSLQPRAPGRYQMRLAEEYLAEHWDRPLDIKGLAEATGVSARTILRYFRKNYGETPRSYLKKMRLERARMMLCDSADATTVIGVALRCGFSSLGHFADSYRARFGELPSNTLRRNE